MVNKWEKNNSFIIIKKLQFFNWLINIMLQWLCFILFLASGHSSLNGTVIGSIITISFTVIIVALICCITVAIVVIIKYRKKHSGLYYSNQNVELDTIKVPFPDTTKSQIQDPCPQYDEVNRSGKHLG